MPASAGYGAEVHPDVSSYFDAAAGLPVHPIAVEAMQEAIADGWADPARLTDAGRRSAVLLDAAREAAADELEIRPDELSFVPSGVHAVQHAVLGTLAGRHRAGTRLVHSAVEHSAVFKAADWHVARGGVVSVVGVDELARVDLAEFVAAASVPGVAAAALQAANHEVGSRQPVPEVAQALDRLGVPLVVDAGHELVYGYLPTGAAVFAADARLWGGPAGVGLLAIRRGTRWQPPFPVDEAESGHSAGAPNVVAIVGAIAALRATRRDRDDTARRLSGLIERIRVRIPEQIADAVVLGDPVDRLPHLLAFSFLDVDGLALLDELGRHGFAVSSGSSCTADTLTPSHVLVAMGTLSSGNVRVSLHSGVTEAAVNRFLAVLPAAVDRIRAQYPALEIPSAALEPATPSGERSGEVVIDSRGRRCPLPVLDLARALPGIDTGAELSVLADDPAAAGDLAAWCRMRGQQLVDATGMGDGATRYRVRRLH